MTDMAPYTCRIPIGYRDKREEGETLLRKCQLVQLHILHVFDAICTQYNLNYWLCSGTLLGALRHGGFIPWDDDIDVGLLRKDFEKFLEVAGAVLPADVILEKPQSNPRMDYRFAKLRDSHSAVYEPLPRLEIVAANGIYIDIFPYDDIPDVPKCMRLFFWKMIYGANRRRLEHTYRMTEVGLLWAWAQYSLAIMFALVHSFMSAIWKVLIWILPTSHIGPPLEHWDRSVCWPKSRVFGMKRHKFEDGQFLIPNEAEKCLEESYGDWRTPDNGANGLRHFTCIVPDA